MAYQFKPRQTSRDLWDGNMNGAFCVTYGATRENRILEYLLENKDVDIAIGDMARELKISRPKVYQVINEFEKKEYVQKSRIVGNTQLYKLNKENQRVLLFLHDFKMCLRFIAEEPQKNPFALIHTAQAGIASAKRISMKR